MAVSSTVGYPDELKEELAEFNPIYLNHLTPIPVENCYSTPHTLGPDRLAAVIGAHSKCPNKDVLVIDVGTAITYDYVTAEGKYLGGNISPGINLRLLSLKEHTAKLPLIVSEGDTPDFGYSTETAIRAGVMNGVKHEIEGYIREIMLKKGDVSVYLTGGSGLCFAEHLKMCTFADEFLVHDGLYNIIMYITNLDGK